jgi:GT2 family glycosyltransferase
MIVLSIAVFDPAAGRLRNVEAMKASIVILNWNGGAESCLESIASALIQNYPQKEIIFVDNGSADGSLEAVKLNYPDITIVSLPENIGCPAGRNKGAEHTTGEIIFFLENDGAWIENDVVSEAIKLFDRDPQLGAIYTRVEGYSTRRVERPIDSFPSESAQTGLYLSSSFKGGASAVRRKLFIELGGFPSDFVRQVEESFLSLQIFEAGYTVAYWPKRVMLHKGSDYLGKSVAVSRYEFQNRMKTILRLYPLFHSLRLLAAKWVFYLFIFLRQKRLGEFLEISNILLKEIFGKSDYKRVSKATVYLSESLKTSRLKLNMEESSINLRDFSSSAKPVSPIFEALKRLLK